MIPKYFALVQKNLSYSTRAMSVKLATFTKFREWVSRASSPLDQIYFHFYYDLTDMPNAFTAYCNGIVITVCKKCLSKHLIADNLGWTKYVGGFDEDNNIEEFMASHGRGDEVNRVSKEVFDLEGILKTNPDPGLPQDEDKGFE